MEDNEQEGHLPKKSRAKRIITYFVKQDRHLNENVLRQAAEQRRRQQQLPEAQQSTAAAAPPPVYPPNAALQAIRRFSARPPFPEMMVISDHSLVKLILNLETSLAFACNFTAQFICMLSVD